MKHYLLLFLILFTSSGCEEDVVSVLGTDRVFSMYSVLNPKRDTQFVRVFPIQETLMANDATPLGAVFESTDLTTGEHHIWTETVTRDATGYAHIFWAPFTAQHEHEYRLQITGAAGQQAFATVEVPPLAEPEVGNPGLSFNVTIPVRFAARIPQLIVSDMSFFTQYTVGRTATGTRILESDTVRVESNHTIRRGQDDISVSLDLSNAAQESKIQAGNDANYDPQFGVELLYIRLRLIVANEAWNPPDGVFDVYELIQPEVMTNVENGFGFIGAGYEVELRWQPDPDVMLSAGFSYFN